MKIWNGNEWEEVDNEQLNSMNRKNKIDTELIKKSNNSPITKNNNDTFSSRLKKTGATIGDLATNVGKGFFSGIENFVDLGRYGVAGVADLVGAKNYANDVRERAKEDTASFLFDPIENVFNKSSALKENGIVENVAQGVGQIGTIIGTGGMLPKAISTVKLGKFAMPTTSILSGMGSGMTEAYNNDATNGQAFIAGLGSGLSEGFSESLFGGLGSTFSKKFGGGALDDVIVKRLTDKISNKTLQTLAQSGLKATGEGFEEVISGIGNAFTKKLTYMNNEDIGKLINDEDLLNSFVVGTLTSAVAQTPSTINSIKTGKSYINLDESSKVDNSEFNNQNKVNDNLLNKNENRYRFLPTNNEKSNSLKQSASKYFNNSQDTANLVNTFDKIAREKNYNILFDDTIKNSSGNFVNAQIKSLSNGEIEIRVNPNSNRAGEFLIMHEVTHAIENDSMKKLIIDYASKNSEFNQALESLKQTYGTNDVSSEVVADISGQLFGNQEFINNLSTKQPNIFKRIYNKIIELANKITGNTKESLFIKDLKNKWEEAYRNTSVEQTINILSDETKHMMTGINGMQNGINVNDRYNDIKNRYNQALKLEKEGIYNNEDIRQQTGWFKDKEGNWEFEISDEFTKFKIQPKKNAKYKLSDIFESNTLYEMYPKLKDIVVSFKDIKGNGKYFAVTNGIDINNKLINNLDSMRGTLLHEIQHYIQKVEGLPEGTSIFFGNEQYANSKGEIEAADTKNRRNLTVNQRKTIIPESSKENPTHPNRQAILNHKRNFIEKIGDKIYNKFGDNSNEISEEFYKENQKENIEIDSSSNRNRLEELDNGSFSLEQRVSGDALLDAQDLIDEVKSVGANVDKNGYVTVYHQTTKENADKIRQSGKMIANEDSVYFSTSKNASQSEGRGQTKLEFKIPAEKLLLDDIFSDNADLKVPLKGSKTLDVSNYLVNDTKYSQQNDNSSILKNSNGKEIDVSDLKENSTMERFHYNRKYDKNNIVTYRGESDNTGSNPAFYGLGLYTTLDSKYAKKYGNVFVVDNSLLPDNPLKFKTQNDFNIWEQELARELGIRKSELYSDDYGVEQYIKKLGYDGLMIGTGKDTDLISYKDVVIKYSQQNDKWQEHLENNYKATGTRTDMKSLELPTVNKETKVTNKTDVLPKYNSNSVLKEENKLSSKKIIKDKINKTIQNQSYKAVNTATKVGQSYLEFDRTQKSEFKSKLSQYIGKTRNELTNAKTWTEIKNLVNDYSNKEITYVDQELKSIKSEIRNSNIKVSQELKQQISDYNEFRKSNFGKLKLGLTGTSIDSFYQELSEQYPYYFGKSLTQEDMLYELSEFMNQDINITQKFKIDETTLNRAATKIYNSLIQNTLNSSEIQEMQNKLEIKMEARTRSVIQEELLEDMGITLSDISIGNDINAIDMSRTDPIRLNEKIFGYKVGQKINDATINKTKHNEAERIRFLNQERDVIKDLGIKPRSKESAAVQKYGEKQYTNDKGDVMPYGDYELSQEFPDVETQKKIKKAAEVIRNKYDSYIDQINNTLVNMGYNPIKKRNDYMRHFQALNDVFSKFGTPLNRESLQNDSLPTDINGLTDQFKPGKQYFASALQRIGMKTEYDAITGIDGYLEGASNLIYHTEDIQRYRTLSKLIRDTYGTTHGFDDIGSLTNEQQAERIKDIQSNKLSKYTAWLDEQANALAGKKGKIDRGIEETFGRKVYTILDTAKKQVGSNMTGYNVRSALTNFASAIQGASKTNKLAFIKGTISTFNNIIKKDGLINKSDFLTSRFGSDSLSPKLWQKVSNAGQIFMTASDYFTANQIWRSKYYENLSKGMTEKQAIQKADDFSARIMGDRSKGATATLFNSKTLGFFTQFQLEVNNQWSSLIHDNKIDIKSGNKTAASIIFQMGQLFAASFFFNNLMKSVTGSDVMIDPIDLIKKILGLDDDDDKSMEERATSALGDVINDLPFASVFTGGRIPVSEAFKGLSTGFKYATGQSDNYGNKYKLSDVGDDLIESAFYWILPTGYGQARKTIKGISMYDKNLPTAGSYTNSGNLRFTADESVGGKIKSALFGQYSSKEAQDYIDSGYKPISKNKLQEMKDLNMTSSEYRDYQKGLSNSGNKISDKINYINSLDVSNEKKNIMANNIIDSKNYKIDMKKYEDYSSYDEMKYAYENPNKYQAITMIGFKYNDYEKIREEISIIKEKNSNSNSTKQEIFNYINSLKYNKHQKLILYNLLGGYSIKNYKKEIFQYIESMKISKEKKEIIWNQLYGGDK